MNLRPTTGKFKGKRHRISIMKEEKKCEVSGQYGKDEFKNLHFYCEFCDKEMEYDEDRVCTIKT